MLQSEDLPTTFVDSDLAIMLKLIDSKPQFRDTLMKKLFTLETTGLRDPTPPHPPFKTSLVGSGLACKAAWLAGLPLATVTPSPQPCLWRSGHEPRQLKRGP